MIKRLCFVIFLSGFFSMIKGDQEREFQALLERIDLVIFILEENSLRMERYGLHELDSEVNLLSKDISDKHSIFSIKTATPGSKAQLIFWDKEDDHRLKIIAGKKSAQRIYYLLLDKLINRDTDFPDLAMIRFDCAVEHSRLLKNKKQKNNVGWKSLVSVSITTGDDELSTKLILDGKVDAACGLFVQRDLFSDKILYTGLIKGKEAINKGILVPSCLDNCNSVLDQDSQQECEEEVFALTSEIESANNLENVHVESTIISQSNVHKLLTRFIAGLSYVAHLFGSQWRKLYSLVF